MRRILVVFGVVAAAVAIGILFAWLATRGPVPANPNSSAVDAHGDTRPSIGTGAASAPRSNHVVSIPQPAHIAPAPTNSGAAPIVAAAGGTNWDDKLEEIIGNSEIDDTNKVKQLFALFPHLPEDGQVEVAQHLSNLVEDENYAPLGQLLTNSALSEAVLDVLMSDVLNRPNTVKLPMFLDLARSTDHPKAGDAKDLLELYLDEDYGTDWAKWRQKMQEWLKENPD